MKKRFTLLQVLRQHNFALLWFGQLVSSVGDWVLLIALPFYVYEQTGSALATGTMVIVENLPNLLFSSLAGVFVDQWDRKRTMVIADLLRAAVLLLLPLLGSSGRLWIVYPVAFASSTITQFFIPAKSALIPRLVGRQHLIEANTLNSLGDHLTSLIGPALGGVFLGLLGLTGVVLIDAASYLISGALIFFISLPAAPPEEQADATTRPTVWRDWLAGLRLVKSERLIAALFAVMGVAMLGQGIIGVLWVVFVREILQGSALEYGWVQVAVAVGGLIGGLVMGYAGKMLPPGRLIGLSGMAIGLLLLATFNLPSLPLILALQVLVGIAAVGFFVTVQTLLQTSTANQYLGRIFGTYRAINGLLQLGGQGLASALGDRLGVVPMLDASGVLYFLGGVVALILLFRIGSARNRSV